MNANPQKFSAQKGAPKSAGKKHDDPFPIREPTVCAALRLSRDRVRERRQHFLAEGQHWAIVGKVVMYSRIGLQILQGTRDATLPPPEKKDAPTGDAAPPRRPIALLVEKNPPAVKFTGKLIAWFSPPRNRRLLMAYIPGADLSNPLNFVSCLVRDNSNFLRGMELPGPGRMVHQLRDNHFELQGEPPRRKGKW